MVRCTIRSDRSSTKTRFFAQFSLRCNKRVSFFVDFSTRQHPHSRLKMGPEFVKEQNVSRCRECENMHRVAATCSAHGLHTSIRERSALPEDLPAVTVEEQGLVPYSVCRIHERIRGK